MDSVDGDSSVPSEFDEPATSFTESIQLTERDSTPPNPSKFRLFSNTPGGQSNKPLSPTLTSDEEIALVNYILQDELRSKTFFQWVRRHCDEIGSEPPEVQIEYRDITVSTNAKLSSSTMQSVGSVLKDFFTGEVFRTDKKTVPLKILNNVSGIVKAGRMTVLVGPPNCGKSTFMKFMAGQVKATKKLHVSGEVMYNGHNPREFSIPGTVAYVSQVDNHDPRLTVKETLDFACLCKWGRAASEKKLDPRLTSKVRILFEREAQREKGVVEEGLEPPFSDAELAELMYEMWNSSMRVEVVMRLLGLHVCRNVLVGGPMTAGISGGQKRRCSLAEMLVGPQSVQMFDEIGTGQDAATICDILAWMQQCNHSLRMTTVVSLQTVSPEVLSKFDDILVLAEGRMLFHGPVPDAIPFFVSLGFYYPPRMDPGTYLLVLLWLSSAESREPGIQYTDPEVLAIIGETGSIGQAPNIPSITEIEQAYWARSTAGRDLYEALECPFNRAAGHPDALKKGGFANKPFPLLRIVVKRQFLLSLRNPILMAGRFIQVLIVGFLVASVYYKLPLTPSGASSYTGMAFMSIVFIVLGAFPSLFTAVENRKQFDKMRDANFYGPAHHVIAMTISTIPIVLLEVLMFDLITAWMVVPTTGASTFFVFFSILFLMSMTTSALLRLLSSVFPDPSISGSLAGIVFVILSVLSGYAIIRPDIPVFVIWGYYMSPFAYALNALAINMLSSPSWALAVTVNGVDTTLGAAALEQFGFFTPTWYIGICALFLFGTLILFTGCMVLCVTYISQRRPDAVVLDHDAVRQAHEEAQARKMALNFQAATAAGGHVAIMVEGDQPPPPPPPEGGLWGKVTRFFGFGGPSPESWTISAVHQQPEAGSEDSENSEGSWSEHEDGGDDSRPAADSSQMAYYPPGAQKRKPDAQAKAVGRSRAVQMTKVAGQRKAEDERDGAMVLAAQAGSAISSSIGYIPITLVFIDIGYEVPNTVYSGRIAKEHAFAVAKALATGAPPPPTPEAAKKKIVLLTSITGLAEPKVLTALMGGSGAGKTTLMDVLAGRKTLGTVSGDIYVNGQPKVQDSWKRLVGYVEQTDIHTADMTIWESLAFSARLRLPASMIDQQVAVYVDEVLQLLELTALMGMPVGRPGMSGLSPEQRKRLTIAVELAANPSVVFMDEPTSGLDARSCLVVMRAVRSVAESGRTVLVTIHQPPIEIFEAFDALILLKQGGKTVFFGELGQNSTKLIAYLQSIRGVRRIEEDANPATWMLEVTGSAASSLVAGLDVDFGVLYAESDIARRSHRKAEQLLARDQASLALSLPTGYAQSSWGQFKCLYLKYNKVWWYSPGLNVSRILVTTACSIVFLAVFWQRGAILTSGTASFTDVRRSIGIMYFAVNFMSIFSRGAVMVLFSEEREVQNRENPSGFYSTLTFGMALSLVDLPWIVGQAFLFTLITYFAAGFILTASSFFYFLICFSEMLLVSVVLGEAIIFATPSMGTAQLAQSLLNFSLNLTAGFVIVFQEMPYFWWWLNRSIPNTYAIWGLADSQLADNDTPVDIGNAVTTVSDVVVNYYGYSPKYQWPILSFLFAFIIGYMFLAVFCLNFLKYHKR